MNGEFNNLCCPLVLACAAECNEGQRRCAGANAINCCNWYVNGTCVVTCPSPLMGDPATFDCGRYFCSTTLFMSLTI